MLAAPASTAVASVGATVSAAYGTLAPTVAMLSSARSSGWHASASSTPSARKGDTATARKSAGWSTATTGVARMLVIGATRLMRPKVHATSGALAMHATHEVSSVRASEARMPVSDAGMHRFASAPLATSAAMPEYAELIAEIEHRGGDDQRSGGSECERRPRRRRSLDEAADGAHAQHDTRSHRGRGKSDHRDVRGRDHERRDARGGGSKPRHAADELHRHRDDRDVQPGDGEHVHDPGHGEAVAHGGIDRALVGDEERAHERRVGAKERVDARADCGARDEERIARAIARDARVRELEPARGDEDRARDRDAVARRSAPPLHGHRGWHCAPGPAHLRADVRAGRRRVLELRAPLRAMRGVRAASRVVRSAPERHAGARGEERAQRGVDAAAPEARDRRIGDTEWNCRSRRAEKPGDEPGGVCEHGDRDERHCASSRASGAPHRIGATRRASREREVTGGGWRGLAATRWIASSTITASCARVWSFCRSSAISAMPVSVPPL